MRKLIFLDIDGVFTHVRCHYGTLSKEQIKSEECWSVFDPIAINFMNKLANQVPDLEFVISSTWGETINLGNEFQKHWMLATFRNAGFMGKFASPMKIDPDNIRPDISNHRGKYIKEYLDDFAPDVSQYLIIDDKEHDFKRVFQNKCWIITDAENGLLYRHMKDILSVVGNWK